MGPKFTKCLHILSDHKHIFASMYTRDLNQCFCVFVSFTLVYALNGFSLCVHIAYKLWLSSSFPQLLLIPQLQQQQQSVSSHQSTFVVLFLCLCAHSTDVVHTYFPSCTCKMNSFAGFPQLRMR